MVGSVYLQLRDGMANQYIDIPLNTSLKGWYAKWFYVRNWEPSIVADIDHYAVPNANWSARPTGEEMNQVEELLDILKTIKLDGVGVAVSFVCRQIQPSKERIIPAYEFTGVDHVTREAPEKLEKGDAYFRLQKFFATSTPLRNLGQQRPYSLSNPRPEASDPTSLASTTMPVAML